MTVSILVPFRPDGGLRDLVWSWLRRRYTMLLPEAEIVTADDPGEHFSRAASFNLAAAEAQGDILLMVDADAVVSAEQLEGAIAQADDSAGMVLAYCRYLYLTERASHEIMAGPVDRGPRPIPEHEWEQWGSVSSVVAVSRKTWDVVGGFDPRFRGWGFEDNAFFYACQTLVAPHRRVEGDVLHLWHPPSPGLDPSVETYQANHALNERYGAACDDPDAMREVLGEWR